MIRFKTLLLITALVSALLVGCNSSSENSRTSQPLPEVNKENCQPENIAKLDKSVQQEFSSKCLRLGPFVTSPEKKW